MTIQRILTLTAVLSMAASSFAQGGKYTIKGTISSADGQTIHLRYGQQHDSTVVKNGKFQFKGETDVPYQRAMFYMGNLDDHRNRRYLRFALEPAKITAQIDIDNFSDAVILGGKTQQESNAFEATLAAENLQMKQLNDAYDKATTSDERDAIRQQMEPYSQAIAEKQLSFIKTHPDSYLAPEFLLYQMGRMDYATLKQVYDAFTPDVKQYGQCEDIRRELSALEKVQPGCVAPDFTAQDINGKPFTMSSLRGHVVIIDFWASWCVPCRKSNPHMLELYKKYRIKGLEMVYVSDDDSNPKAWRKAVEKDRLTGEGFHHVLRGIKWDRSKGIEGIDRTNDISSKYAIHYLPTKYLIDAEGRIVCKIDEGDETKLEHHLERLLGKAEYPFTVEGTVSGADGQQLTLLYGSMGQQQTLTTTVEAGKFCFGGILGQPYSAATLILGQWDSRNGGDACQLALEEGTITISAPTGRLGEATIKGGRAQEDINAYNQAIKPYMEPIAELNRQYYATKDERQRKAIQAKLDPLAKKYGEISDTWYLTHPDSYLSPSLFMPKMGDMSYEDICRQYYQFSERVRLYGDTQEIEQEIEALGHVQPGCEAPDFTAEDINGQQFTLSSLKGKVVIIDFWASWCVPCRKSNPHMLELYKKYHDRGLDMVYVSDDDSTPDKWRAAVEKDQLSGDGFHHVLRGFKMNRETGERDFTNDISQKYAIHYLPTKYLIDREGRIVCKIGEGEDQTLDERIESLIAK